MGKGSPAPASGPQQVTTTSTTSNLPEYARPYFENLMNRAQAESYRPYQPYQTERIAEFAPGQVAAQQETAGLTTPTQFAGATQLTGLSGLGSLGAGAAYQNMATNPNAVSAYMSPYMQNVVDYQKEQAIKDYSRGLPGMGAAAARSGAFGGSRHAIVEAEGQRNLQNQLAGIQALGTQSAYDQAMRNQQFGANLGLQGLGQAGQLGAQLGNIGSAEQQANLQRISAQSTAGAEQRNLAQQRLDQAYADFLRQRDYPMEQLGYYSNILRGLPVGLSSTATTAVPPPSLASQVGGLGLAGLGLYNLAKNT
jgi:hypothetical protein